LAGGAELADQPPGAAAAMIRALSQSLVEGPRPAIAGGLLAMSRLGRG